jgi:peptidylprolyl isomerase
MLKKHFFCAYIALGALCTTFIHAENKIDNPSISEATPQIDMEKISETLGHLIVRHLKNPGLEFNFDKIIQGIQNERAGKVSPMNEEEYEQTIAQLQEGFFLKTAEKNLSDANAFMEKNAKTEGVISVDDKLQYKVVQDGEGAEVSQDSLPLIHYKGQLIDGTVFANSQETGSPITIPVKQAIPGFSKGLVGMKKGEKRILYIHPDNAYGLNGQLPPNSLLIFEVEIVQANTDLED